MLLELSMRWLAVLWRSRRRLLWIVKAATATGRLAARWRGRLGRGRILPLVPQPGVDLLGTEISKCWINQGVLGQGYPITDEDWVDGIVGGLIPQLRIPLSAPAVVCQGTVHDLMSQDTLQFSRSEVLDKCRIIGKSTPIGGHGGETRHGNQLQAQAKRSEKRLAQQQLRAG